MHSCISCSASGSEVRASRLTLSINGGNDAKYRQRVHHYFNALLLLNKILEQWPLSQHFFESSILGIVSLRTFDAPKFSCNNLKHVPAIHASMKFKFHISNDMIEVQKQKTQMVKMILNIHVYWWHFPLEMGEGLEACSKPTDQIVISWSWELQKDGEWFFQQIRCLVNDWQHVQYKWTLEREDTCEQG